MQDWLQEWELDSAGRPHREAARIILLDRDNNIFLQHGHDGDDPLDHQWWFTVGGGKQASESYREAAAREAFEETGWKIVPEQLVGPVLRRHAEFRMLKQTMYQSEYFYLYRLSERKPCPNNSGFTESEKELVTGSRWWNLHELENAQASGNPVIYPLRLATYLQEWIHGWNGETPEIYEGTVGPRGRS